MLCKSLKIFIFATALWGWNKLVNGEASSTELLNVFVYANWHQGLRKAKRLSIIEYNNLEFPGNLGKGG